MFNAPVVTPLTRPPSASGDPLKCQRNAGVGMPVAGVPQQPAVPAGFPTAVPPGYAANMVSALEAAGVAVPGLTRAGQPRSRTWIWGLGILMKVGMTALFM